MMGVKLVALVCKHMRAVFRAHRRALKNNVEYCARTRDHPLNADGSGGESATEDDDGMLCVDGAVGDTTPLSTGLPAVYSRATQSGVCPENRFGGALM